MKKIITLSIMALAVLAFTVSPVLAGESCGSKKTADKAADKASCSGHSTNAIKASAKTTCTPEEIAACAKAMNVSPEECAKMCGPDGKMTMHTISIKGMTCGGCESSVTKVIEGVDGVQKVVNISHKDGTALVCVDKEKTCLTTLTKAVTDKGYEAQIIPAVAKTDSPTATAAKSSCSKTCTSKEKAACDSKKAEKKAEGTN